MISLASVQPTFSLVTVVSRRQPARQMKPTQVPNTAVPLAATPGWLQQCAQIDAHVKRSNLDRFTWTKSYDLSLSQFLLRPFIILELMKLILVQLHLVYSWSWSELLAVAFISQFLFRLLVSTNHSKVSELVNKRNLCKVSLFIQRFG